MKVLSMDWSATLNPSRTCKHMSCRLVTRPSRGMHRNPSQVLSARCLSVGLRVRVRRRVAGDDPRTDHNNDGKGVKRAEVPPAENFPGCPGVCLSAWSSVCVSGSWSCACLVFPGAGRWVSVSGAVFPCGWLLPLSSWFRLLCWLS